MKENIIKGALVAALAALGAYFEALVIPLIVAAVVMCSDYLSGVAAAWTRGELSSRTGIVGIIKKVSYVLIIVVGIVVDWVIQTAAARLGISTGNFYYLGLLVTIWLILNECISILENVSRLGVTLPPFLLKLITHLKESTENKGEEIDK